MLRNNLLITLRSLMNNSFFSFINLTGLTIGMTACLLILLYVNFELSFDKFHQDQERIYRVTTNRYHEGELQSQRANGYSGIGPAMLTDIPEVEAYSRILPMEGVVSSHEADATGDKTTFREEELLFVDASFLSMFSFAPGLDNALNTPNSVVISQSSARKYFGEQDPVGKLITFGNGNLPQLPFRVTGVFLDVVENSHLQFDMLFSYSTLFPYWEVYEFNWDYSLVYTYIRLTAGAQLEDISSKLSGLVQKYKGEQMAARNMRYELMLQPMADIHLGSNLVHELDPSGDRQIINLLLMIALLIILIAWINYVNLTTAQWIGRAREVGVRKVIGASHTSLFGKFILETFVINLAAACLSLTLVQLFFPYFESLHGYQLSASLWANKKLVFLILAGYMAGALLTGSYPAWILASLPGKDALKNKLSSQLSNDNLRRALIVFQFSIALAMIAGTLAINAQLAFMRSQKLGFNTDKILVLKGPEISSSADSLEARKINSFKEQLNQYADITSITASNTIPGNRVYWNGAIHRQGTDVDEGKDYGFVFTDDNYLKTYELQLVAGRHFRQETVPSTSRPVIINELAMQRLGFSSADAALGQQIVQSAGSGTAFEIIGVIENYHQASLKEDFIPLILVHDDASADFISLQLSTGDLQLQLENIESVWEEVFIDQPLDYFFLDDFFNKQYQQEQKFGQMFGIFSGLAILIACTGLFGLVTFMVNRKAKEIGIRKVLGAGVVSILQLLTKDFFRIIIISSLVALPIAYFGIREWLEQYAFRIQAAWPLFLIPLVMLSFIVLLTISYQVIKTAYINPTSSLRYE